MYLFVVVSVLLFMLRFCHWLFITFHRIHRLNATTAHHAHDIDKIEAADEQKNIPHDIVLLVDVRRIDDTRITTTTNTCSLIPFFFFLRFLPQHLQTVRDVADPQECAQNVAMVVSGTFPDVPNTVPIHAHSNIILNIA